MKIFLEISSCVSWIFLNYFTVIYMIEKNCQLCLLRISWPLCKTNSLRRRRASTMNMR
jgi:hypothetical protein